MLICRYLTDSGPMFGLIEERQVYLLDGDPFSATALEPGSQRPALQRGPFVGAVDEVRLLAPVQPGKLVCVGRNYAAHAKERDEEVPTEPLLFFKPTSAVIGPGAAIELLPEMGRVEHEAELAIVMGRRGRFIPEKDALGYVFGYTCADDVSERDYQARDGQWTRAKGFDTFCPLGPWINTKLDPANVTIRCRVDGEARQNGHSADMIFKPARLIAHISRIMTLEPGDVILTGTPAGVSPIRPGSTVEVEVEGIGVLRNPVVMRQA